MTKLNIIGAGGLAKELISYIESGLENRFNIVGCWSTQKFNNELFDKYYRGSIKDFRESYRDDESVIIAIADGEVRKRIIEDSLSHEKFKFFTYIHETSIISPYAKIGVGSIIMPFCIVAADAVINDHVFLNTECAVGHDSIVGSYNCLHPKVEICGNSLIENGCEFGIGSIVLPGVRVKAGCKISGLSLLKSSTIEKGVYAGNPAKLVKTLL